MTTNVSPSFTGLVIFYEERNYAYQLRSLVSSYASSNNIFTETILPSVYMITVHGSQGDRDRLVERIKTFNGVQILARIDYNGYIVHKTYESTEYKGEIQS